MNVKYVIKHSGIPVIFESMKDLTLKRNPMNVWSVEWPSDLPVPYNHTKGLT